MELKQQITEDMKNAMRTKDTVRLSTVRLLLAAIKQREVDERISLDDTAVLAVIEKMLKQRRDSITAYEGAGRIDLADIEKAESTILQAYLPAQLSEAEIIGMIEKVIEETGAYGVKDMGKVVSVVKPLVAGKADIAKVSAVIKSKLG